MAPLDAKVDSLEGVPEQYHDLYSETENGYKLEVRGVEFPEDVEGLKSALQKERQAAKDAASKLKDFEGLDVSEYKSLLEERERRDEEAAAKRGEFDKLLEKKQTAFNEQLQQERQRSEALEAQVLGLVRDQEARKALEQAGANVRLMLPHVLDKVGVVEEDGTRKAVVLNNDGVPRLNDEGKQLSIMELVSEMAESEEYRAGFPGTVAKGGGAAAGSAGRANTGFDPSSATDAEKAAYIAKNGRDAFYQALGVS